MGRRSAYQPFEWTWITDQREWAGEHLNFLLRVGNDSLYRLENPCHIVVNKLQDSYIQFLVDQPEKPARFKHAGLFVPGGFVFRMGPRTPSGRIRGRKPADEFVSRVIGKIHLPTSPSVR